MVWGLGSGLRVWGLGFRAKGLGFRFGGCRVQGAEARQIPIWTSEKWKIKRKKDRQTGIMWGFYGLHDGE